MQRSNILSSLFMVEGTKGYVFILPFYIILTLSLSHFFIFFFLFFIFFFLSFFFYSGRGTGELMAMNANLIAIVKILSPLIFGWLYGTGKK